MNILASILIAIVAGVVLIIAKAISVAKMINERNYSFVRFGLIAAFWAALTIPSLGSSCGPIGCTYGLHFGWVLELIKVAMPSNAIFFVVGGYAILSVFFFSHALGWIFYLLRAFARPVSR
ncbi:hypothetical protein OHD62_03645 [Mesorhizobium sp. YC-39]|uniref:hypothetical protein n=1 Tax=unclassified Mesorhizobium TaxID=325217 RepID=UPI0021E76D8E|nr:MULTISPECIES: hypothetical protein [unclassified Mesorhizobium]MCV3206143.1 hypothetical protein [Mesorhizobium sp. YC-2]MCV3227457.1 hypothetical protein [Mesorhizobium sp. YC-39]